MTTKQQAEWLERVEAARRLQVPADAIDRLVEQGEIRTRDLPVRARYSGADVDRLAGRNHPARPTPTR